MARCSRRAPMTPIRSCGFSARASTTCAMSTSTCRATRSSPSPGSRARASRRWPSARSTPRRSAATSSRLRRTPAGCCCPAGAPKVDDITGLPPAVALQQRRGRRRRARPSARSRRCPTRCGCCSPVRGPIHPALTERLDSDCVLAEHRRRRLPRVPRPGPDPSGHRGDARPRPVADHPRGRGRRLAGRLAGAEPARHPDHPRLRRRPAVAQAAEAATATGSCSPTSSRPWRSTRPRERDRRLHLQRHLLQRPSATCCTRWRTPRAR